MLRRKSRRLEKRREEWDNKEKMEEDKEMEPKSHQKAAEEKVVKKETLLDKLPQPEKTNSSKVAPFKQPKRKTRKYHD